jgi:hypothetical protein
VERDGENIVVTVTNREPAADPNSDPNLACTLEYRYHEELIELGTNFRNGTTYTVDVNGVTETFVGAALDDGMIRDMVEVPAPVNSVVLEVSEADPEVYTLVVTTVRPMGSSCSEFGGYEVERNGNEIEVTITNLEVADQNVPCTRDLPIDQTRIDLGSDFEDGATYTVSVNGDRKLTFTAGEMQQSVGLDQPFRIGVGEIVSVGVEGLEVALVEVVSDSRCPLGTKCITAGEAVITIDIAAASQSLGQHQLVLDSMSGQPPVAAAGQYEIRIDALAPNPRDVGEFDKEAAEYIATLEVSMSGS